MKLLKIVTMTTLFAVMVSGCASTASLKSQYSGYKYYGEKYGKVEVTQSDNVAKDARKGVRLEEMSLDTKIVNQLKTAGVYDESSGNSISVVINSIHIRNAFNAVMLGVLAGADSLNGTVTLMKGDKQLACFDVKASYALGGTAGGQNQVRLGWLSDKFAEETAQMILGTK